MNNPFGSVADPANPDPASQGTVIAFLKGILARLAGSGGGISGTVTADQGAAGGEPWPVSGPLTDAELRASALPVAGPLTDAELRASAVPVSGPLTDTELRAASVQIVDTWSLQLQADENLNDSDKSFAVPSGYEWQVLWIWVELTTTATAGNRQVTVELQDDAADVIAQWRAGTTQAASLARYYCFAPANADLDAFRDTDYLSTTLPPTVILPAGYTIRVYDRAGVDAAADDMVVQMMVARRAV